MALINCPQCGNKIDDHIFNKCSKCGYIIPIKLNARQKKYLIIIGIVFLVWLVLFSIAKFIESKREYTIKIQKLTKVETIVISNIFNDNIGNIQKISLLT